jgi:hypothetical protein
MMVYFGKGNGSLRLFSSRRIRCESCENGKDIGFGEIACNKHGIVSDKKQCKNFKQKDSVRNKSKPPKHTIPPIEPDKGKDILAKSTLITDYGLEGLIKVFEVGAGIYATKETIKNRIWIHDLFDDNGIEYYIEMELKNQGKQLAEVQSIYVRPEEKENASFLIWSFSKGEFVKPEYTPDVTTQTMVDGIPQKQCGNCKEEIDFDYHTCPHCKTAV